MEDALQKLDLDECLDRFTRDRARLVDRLRTLRPEDWRRTTQHDDYNAYSVFIMFPPGAPRFPPHAYRIEELLLRRDWPAPAGLT